MKPKFSTPAIQLSATLALCALALPNLATAQITGEWNTSANGSWGNATLWTSNPDIPGTTLTGGDTAIVNFNITANRTITLDGERILGTLTIGDPTTSYFTYTVSAGTGGSINFDAIGSGTANLIFNSGAVTISAPVTLSDNLRVMDAGTLNLGRTLSGVISGAASLTFDNDDGLVPADPVATIGQFALNGANTFSGGVTIDDVRVASGNATGYGTGTVTVLEGGGAWLNTGAAFANNFVLSGEGWLEASGYLSSIRMNANSSINGTVTLTGTPGDSAGTSPDGSLFPDPAAAGTSTATVNGVISGGDLLVGSFSAGGTWTGTNNLALTAANTYGDTIISAFDLPTAGQTIVSVGNSTANTTATLGTGDVYLHGGDAGKIASLRIWRGGGYTLAQNIHTMNPANKTALILDVSDSGFTTNGKSITVSEQIRVGGNAPGTSLNIDAGSVVSAGQFFIGNGVNNSATVNQTAGAVTVSGEVRLGHFSTETSIYNLSGGSLTLSGLPIANPFTVGSTEATDGKGTLYVGIDGQGVFNQTGGTVNAAAIVLDNRGNTAAGTNMATGTDTYTLAGGTLNLGSTDANGDWGISGNASTLFDFAGGTLALGTSLPISVPVAFTGTGSVLDTKGFTATFTGPFSGTGTLGLADSTATTGTVVLNPASDISVSGFTGSAPLVKFGPATLTLTGTSARIGLNRISQGVLRVTGSLGGNTIVQGATLATGGTINGNLTLGDAADSVLRYDGSPLQVNGDLILSSGSSNMVKPFGNGSLANGVYPLLQFTGSLTGSFAYLILDPAVVSGYRQSFALSLDSNTINLTVSGSTKSLTWSGTESIWDIADTPGWLDQTPAADQFFQLDAVTFDDSASNAVLQLAGTLSPSSVTVNASTNAYQFTSTGSFAGAFPLLKKGSAKLSLATANSSWNGPVTIANGEVEAAAAGGLGTGDLIFGDASTTSGDINRATWTTGANTATSVTVSPEALDARLVSTGGTLVVPSIVKKGPGTLTIGHETYTTTTNLFTGITGGILVEQGTLAFSSRTPVPNGTGITLGNLNTGNENTVLEIGRSDVGDGPVLNAAITLGTLPEGSTSQAIVRYRGVNWNGNASGGAPTLNGNINLNGRSLYVENTSTISGADAGRLWNLTASISGAGDVHIRNGTVADGNYNGAARSRLSAANSWIGDLYLDTGMLQLSSGGAGTLNAIPDTATVYMAPGTRIGFGSNGETIAGLVGGAANGAVAAAIIDDNFSSSSSSFTLTLSGSGTYVFDGIFRRSSVGTGLNNIIKSGTGTQVFNGASTNTGTVTITGGTLAIGHNSALGTGTVNLNGASATLRSADANPRTIANPITYSTDFTLGSPGTGDLTFTGNVNVGSLSKVFNIQNAVTTFSGVLSGSGTPTRTKSGPGTLVFTGANTYPGTTIVSQGTLRLGASNVLADASLLSLGAGTLATAVGVSETVGTLDVTDAASTINLGTGSTLAFADSSAVDWTGGTLTLTGNFVSGTSLRFGTGSAGLTPAQLAQISASGFQNFSLDANGYLTATPVGETFNSFVQSNFSLEDQGDPLVSGPTADPDGDGIINILEYAFGLNPAVSGNGNLPVSSTTEFSGSTHLRSVFTRVKDATDLTFTVQFSNVPDASGFTSAVEGSDYTLVNTVDNGNGTETITIRDNTAVVSGMRRFIRILVTYP